MIPIVVPYRSYRDELTAKNGGIFRGETLAMSMSLRSDTKRFIYQPYSGIEIWLRLPRDLIFCPVCPLKNDSSNQFLKFGKYIKQRKILETSYES